MTLSDLQVEERASSASAMLNDLVFEAAINTMRAQYIDALTKAAVGSPEASTAHAGVKMLEDFKATLQAMITEKKMRARYPRSVDNGR